MATTKGTAVSFNNTPQARDDFFSTALTGLTEDNLASHALLLDVMANDAGGNAKSLYSLDDGINSAGASGDLLQRDIVGGANRSLHGATINITADGKISYDASTLDGGFVADLQHLAAGEFAIDTFTYAIQLGNGTLSWATATVQIAGMNDAPVVSGPVIGNATEDGSAVALNALVSATDVDHGAVLSVTGVSSQLPAGVSYDPASHSFTLDPSNGAYQHLALGQSTTVTVNYGVTDGIATTPASVSWTVTGTNDAPVVSATVMGTATEDGPAVALNALANATDVDDSATLFVNNAPAVLPAGVSYDPASHSFTLDPSNGAYQHLALGQSTTVTVNYGVTDGIATTPASASWFFTGTNDAPMAFVDQASAKEDTLSNPVSGNVLTNDTDVDTLDTHRVTAVNGAALNVGHDIAGTYGTLHLSADGGYSYMLDNTRAAVQALSVGQTAQDVFSYTNTDNNGATSSSTLTVNVAGSNDAPTLSDPTGGSQQLTQTDLTLNAIMAFADVDLSDIHSVTVTSLTPGAVGNASALVGSDSTGTGQGQINLSYHLTKTQYDAAGVNIPAILAYRVTINDQNGGVASHDTSIPLAQILNGGNNNLPPQSPQFIGGTLSGTVTDDPTKEFVTIGGIANFTDADAGQHTAFIGGLPDGVTAHVMIQSDTTANNHNGSVGWMFSYDEGYLQHLGAGEFRIDQFPLGLVDSTGNSTFTNITITANGINEAPQISGPDALFFSFPEFGATLGAPEPHHLNGGFGAIDVDNNDAATFRLGTQIFTSNETLTTSTSYLINPIFGISSGVGTQTSTLTLEQAIGTFTGNLQQIADSFHVDPTGQWTFDAPDYLFDSISQGGVLTLRSQVVVDDHHGGTDTAQVLIDIHGQNDGVQLQNQFQNIAPMNAGDGTLTFAGNVAFTDADFFDLHSVSGQLLNTPQGPIGSLSLSIQDESTLGGTGIMHWEYTVTAPDSLPNNSPILAGFNYTVDDHQGGAMSGDVTLTINPNPNGWLMLH